MIWQMSDRFDPRSVAIADRHYSRQKPGTPQFVPPGRCLVLYAENSGGEAVWATSWQAWAQHAWLGAWVCTIFRNEGAARHKQDPDDGRPLASEMIGQAVAATRAFFGETPDLGMITFILPSAVRSVNPGSCFIHAGFEKAGFTMGGKPCLQLLPARMPNAEEPLNFQRRMEFWT